MRGTKGEVTAPDAEVTRRIYDRIAPVYDYFDAAYEYGFKRKMREYLFTHATGRILDAGVGTGCNMPFYPRDQRVTAIDASRGMLARAEKRARKLGLDVEFGCMNLLDLDLPDNSFDTTVITFVLVCLPDDCQEQALRELARVTKPGGRILLLDYRATGNPLRQQLSRLRRRLTRWAFAAATNPATDRYLEPAGLEIARQDVFHNGSVVLQHLAHRKADAKGEKKDAAAA